MSATQPARKNAPRVVVVGSGAGGAAAARELAGSCRVTVLEAGREFRPFSLPLGWLQRLRDSGLLFDPRLIRLAFPAMRVRRARDGLVLVNGAAAGGTTVLSTGNALRRDQDLRRIGVDLDREFAELAREIPVSVAHRAGWSGVTRRLFEIAGELGLDPQPTPKFVDARRCRRCGRCVLGCPHGAKWDSRRFLNDALAAGAEIRTGWRVTRVVIRGGRAIGVQARAGARTLFLPADLVILAAGGLGTPAILERSGIPCEPRLFVDPVLCVAAPRPGSRQHLEVPMPFIIQRPGYMISPYFDYLSFLFNRDWRGPADRVLALMIKLADSGAGSVRVARGRLDKGLTARDRERLAEAEALCRRILVRLGSDPARIVTGTLNAGHPGGMLPLTAADAGTLHPAGLPGNLYAADASLLPTAPGGPSILTILALARRTARAALAALEPPARGLPVAVAPASPLSGPRGYCRKTHHERRRGSIPRCAAR
jgi:choline dehydrogenase-like flavoprotein